MPASPREGHHSFDCSKCQDCPWGTVTVDRVAKCLKDLPASLVAPVPQSGPCLLAPGLSRWSSQCSECQSFCILWWAQGEISQFKFKWGEGGNRRSSVGRSAGTSLALEGSGTFFPCPLCSPTGTRGVWQAKPHTPGCWAIPSLSPH